MWQVITIAYDIKSQEQNKRNVVTVQPNFVINSCKLISSRLLYLYLYYVMSHILFHFVLLFNFQYRSILLFICMLIYYITLFDFSKLMSENGPLDFNEVKNYIFD